MQPGDLHQLSGHQERLDRVIDAGVIGANDVADHDRDDEVVAKVVAAKEWRNELIEEIKSPRLVKGARLPWGSRYENLRSCCGRLPRWTHCLSCAANHPPEQGRRSCLALKQPRTQEHQATVPNGCTLISIASIGLPMGYDF